MIFSMRLVASLFGACAMSLFVLPSAEAASPRAAMRDRYESEIKPILEARCYGCHGFGSQEGQVVLDEFDSDQSLKNPGLWLRVLKNIRADLMPPAGEDELTADEQTLIENWIKDSVFELDPENPDPGHVTLRRLNRHEYRNTIRDLLGVDFRADQNFPADDTGHGFENIGDLLSISPILVEKYMQAANEIVHEAVPSAKFVMREQTISGADFLAGGKKNPKSSPSVSCGKAATFHYDVTVTEPGSYRVVLDAIARGEVYFYNKGESLIRVLCDDELLFEEKFGWQDQTNGAPVHCDFTREWQPGPVRLTLQIEPRPVEGDDGKPKPVPVVLELDKVRIEGPQAPEQWEEHPEYARFFPRAEVPQDPEQRREYTRELLGAFATKAFRRPVGEATLDRLVELAESASSVPGASFEQGIQQAMIATLCSQRFLFLVEHPVPEDADKPVQLLDEYSLASRLSYLLWSSMPDDELFNLAAAGELRKNLDQQVTRMLDDPKSRAFIESFGGQWLRTREVDTVEIDTRLVVARDYGLDDEETRFRYELARRIRRSELGLPPSKATYPPPVLEKNVNLDDELRQAMRQETELCLDYVVRNDRSVLELIDSDYTFLNQRLAEHYGIEGVAGKEMRKVDLPADSHRGGILTHAGILMITSQSTRTSAVKRGIYVLDNLLGTPPPPAPPNIPALEASDLSIEGREPTLRELLEWHRQSPLCASCHNRMDPLGLSLENFNALGMWRTQEKNQDIFVEGRLASGEELASVAELRRILATDRRFDFYHCLTEKLLMYSIGRGLEYYDTQVIDEIVEHLERDEGRFLTLLNGVIHSAPFQKTRNVSLLSADETH